MNDETTEEVTLQTVRADIATASTLMGRSLHGMDQVREHISAAENALREAETEITHATLALEGVPTQDYLTRATEHIDNVRTRSIAGANLTLDLHDHLTGAQAALIRARQGISSLEQQAHPNAADVTQLGAMTDEDYRFIGAAAPMLRAAHTHLQEAADAAARLLNPDLSQVHRAFSIFQVDRGVQVTARSLARADESSRHLDRAMENSAAASVRSLAHADALANAARTHTTPGSPSRPRR